MGMKKKLKFYADIRMEQFTFEGSKLQRWIAPFWNQRKITDVLNPISTYLQKKFLYPI
jgi:hypothetical protein